MAGKFNIDGDAIRQLAEILVETDLSEIEYESDGSRVRVARNVQMVATLPTAASLTPQVQSPTSGKPAPSETPQDFASHPGAIKSPMVGTVYSSPEPGAASFVKVGDSISVGQTLLIIEAMKVMNPIKAQKAGKVTHVLFSDAQPVEYGEPLLIIE
ncbi:acetyl-CoA carboxylase biotin carboxyl carrier protein [Candidatus Paracaedibacter symbiosus]|uniref:acetyl-CoA carboxylase biotin carboxyl carrier protein n=1 Tax=Candidatus Paracaedibacter symbiosus TaxID=244582 RepID=UPI0005096199|nr:acetyl-CoA carboxylase biotin carboxyl carrier protein [Candidatus Paracaedibacter symbiosus]